MPILADHLRDANNKLYRIYPDANGELHIAPPVESDAWTDDTYTSDSWTDPSYTTPDTPLLYQTLADSAGTTWYVYVNTDGEIVISTVQPTGQDATLTGAWREFLEITPTEATVGDEIYLALKDSDNTDWYVYPNSNGELIITNTEPS